MSRISRMSCLLICILTTGCASLLPGAYEAGNEEPGYADIAFESIGKENVHIYLVHGWDPLDVGQLNKLQEHCEEQGYSQVKIVQFYEWGRVINEVASIKAEEPAARIFMLGFSAGANSVTHMVNELHDDYQIDVDRVFYLAGIMLIDTAYARPSYVGKIVHIRDSGFLLPGMNLTGAENYRFRDVWHYGTPTHPDTYKLMDQELNTLAALPR